jgi:flavin reductase (DIM6/NTAB) family NADH-FMN oxidoreductase RutF
VQWVRFVRKADDVQPARLRAVPGGDVAFDADGFKQVLSHWVTGVTIVTARDGDRIHGMTVSAFTEVSLDPPLVLICADKASNTHPVIAAGKVFAVNVLCSDQVELSNKFASKKTEATRFDGLAYTTGETGAPLIDDVVANLDCRLVAAHDHGDHIVYVGEVVDVRYHDREPLIYRGGSYGEFSKS